MEIPEVGEDATSEDMALANRQATFNHAVISEWYQEHPEQNEARAAAREAFWATPHRERPGLVGEVARALGEAMEDLLRPTSVRDVRFNILGRDNLPDLEPEVFADAGCTAEYLLQRKSEPQVLGGGFMSRVVRESDYRDGSLCLSQAESGDVSVHIIDSRGRNGASATFCTAQGGGRSLRTRRALVELLRAMQEDAQVLGGSNGK